METIKSLKGIQVEVEIDGKPTVGTVLSTTSEYMPNHNTKNHIGINFSNGLVENVHKDSIKILEPIIAIKTKNNEIIKCLTNQFKLEYNAKGNLKAISLCEKKNGKKSFKLIEKFPASKIEAISFKLNLFVDVNCL